MSEPIKAGDTCRIIRGLTQAKSPNVGLVVKVGPTIMGNHGAPHTRFGRIVRVEGEGVCQMGDGGEFLPLGWADIPVAWLERVEPDAPQAEVLGAERGVSA
jgi:hypothetical protein